MSINKDSKTEIGVKVVNNSNDLICKSAIEKELITSKGGVFKINFKLKSNESKRSQQNSILNLNMNMNNIEMNSVYGRPCISIVSKDYRMFGKVGGVGGVGDEEIERIFLKHNGVDNSKPIYSSFLETDSGTKFYSNDLLMKLEKGLDGVTEKIFDGSKKINEMKT